MKITLYFFEDEKRWKYPVSRAEIEIEEAYIIGLLSALIDDKDKGSTSEQKEG